MLKLPLKKKLLICIIIFSSCSSPSSEIDISDLSTSTSTSTSSTTTTLVNKEYAKDLEVGDCFEFLNIDLDYFTFEEEILIVECDELHTNEIITTISFKSNEETLFNDDNVPNNDIYDSCIQSYFDKYSRPLAGTLTYIDWIGDTTNFDTESKYLCYVSVPNLTRGTDFYKSNISYQTYIEEFISTSKETTFGELSRGSCFNNRTPDVAFINNTLVDLRPCSFPHNTEIIAEIEIPDTFIDSEDIDFWALDACFTLGAFYQGLEFRDEERFDRLQIYVDYVFDDIQWELGETKTIKCIAMVYPYQDFSFVWEKNYSIADLADDLLLGYIAEPEEGEDRILLACPNEEELGERGSYSELFMYYQNPNAPIELLEVTISDKLGDHTVDLTESLKVTGLQEEQVMGLFYEIYYFYIMSFTGFESVEAIDNGEVSSFISSITATFRDSDGNEFTDTCIVEGG